MNYKSRLRVDLHVIEAIDEKAFTEGKSDAAKNRFQIQGV
jgi:hypothetical protein